jgi:hypothetical protein
MIYISIKHPGLSHYFFKNQNNIAFSCFYDSRNYKELEIQGGGWSRWSSLRNKERWMKIK